MIRPSLRRGQGLASYDVTASLLWWAGIIAVTALATGDLRAVLSGGARWGLTRHRHVIVPAIRGGATVMDSIFKAEDAPGSGSEHGENAEIA
jgi:hypothetical protein